jgi:molybdopterin converting factor small subunit
MSKIIIPTPLRKFTENHSSFETNKETVNEAIRDLTSQYPNVKKHLFDESEQFRSFINIFVGEEDIRGLQKGDTPLQGNETVSIIPAIAGGSI